MESHWQIQGEGKILGEGGGSDPPPYIIPLGLYFEYLSDATFLQRQDRVLLIYNIIVIIVIIIIIIVIIFIILQPRPLPPRESPPSTTKAPRVY